MKRYQFVEEALAEYEDAIEYFAQLREHIIEAVDARVSVDTPEIALAASEGLRRSTTMSRDVWRLSDPRAKDSAGYPWPRSRDRDR